MSDTPPALVLPLHGKLYSIPAAYPFIETLARGLLEQAKCREGSLGDVSFAEWLIFLPTRRACFELRQALLRLSAPEASQADEATNNIGHAVLLPRLVPLGDVMSDTMDDTMGEEADDGADDAMGEKTEREFVSALQRRLLLAQLIEKWLDSRASRESEQATQAHASPAAPATISLARALERLQADFVLEETTPQQTLTADMVPANCAAHWSEALDFLRIVIDKWPQVLEEQGLSDPNLERVRTLARHAEEIAEHQVARRKAPVIVAGSTGSLKATARLMRSVLSLTQGQVILAGCPAPLDASSRRALFEEGEEATHPLHPFRALFASLGRQWNMTQEQVANLLEPYSTASPTAPSCSPRQQRISLLAQAFSQRPTPMTIEQHVGLGLTVLPCSEAQEEAHLIALILREALEKKGQRAALITRDRTLARRVRSALKGRWNLAIEDTAQQPLADSRAAQLFLLTLKALVPEEAPAEKFLSEESPSNAPSKTLLLNIVCLQALFARAGGTLALAWQNFEGNILRKPDRRDPTKTQRATVSLQALNALLEKNQSRSEKKNATPLPQPFAQSLAQAFATLAPLAELLSGKKPPASHPTSLALLRCHRQCAENFVALCHNDDASSAASSSPELSPLYREEGGRELKRFCDTLDGHWQENTQKDTQKDTQEDNAQGDSQDYLPTLEALLAAETRRGLYATHPRLAILGALEARLLSFDLLVLGGLTEGSWPAQPDKSPFLPESLRAKVGLKPLEHNIGLSALDFVNFASAPKRVVLTYAARHNGQPQQPSRFLQRLQTCHPCLDHAYGKTLRAWLAALQHGEQKAGTKFSLLPPAPKAPQAARPLRVSLTRLATLIEDPYSLYAQQVLRLAPLEPLIVRNEQQLYGSCLHACFEEILKTPARNKEQPATKFLEDIIAKKLACFAPSCFAQAFWKEPLLRSAERMLAHVKALQPQRLWCEVAGEHRIALENGRSLTLSARADLIVEAQDGSWWLIDHKTGALPTRTSLSNFEQPQLVLGAWLLQQGAFKAEGKTLAPTTLPATQSQFLPQSLPQSCYWRFSGRRADNSVLAIDEKVWANNEEKAFETAQSFAEACFASYATLLQRFDRAETPYPARVLSLPRAQYDPYRHLARRQAWSSDLESAAESAEN